MTPFFKKLNLALSLFLAGFATYSYSDMNSCLCVEKTCCAPCPPQCGHGFIGADLLYWRPFQDGLDTCCPTDVSNTTLPDGRIISTFEGRGKNADFKWNPGFRVGAGYEFACSNWDIGALWTHFNSKAHGSQCDENRFRWNIDLDVIDLLVAYHCNCNSCFTLRPYVGLRGARIDQKLRHGRSPNSTTFAITDNNLTGTHNKQKFNGLGPLIGLETDVKVACGFSLFVNGTVSWLYGRNDVRFTNSTATIDVIDFCRIKNKIDSTLLAADASIGVRWQRCFCTNKQFFLQLSYEHHRYFDYSRIGNCGDLSFDGVQIGLGVGF